MLEREGLGWSRKTISHYYNELGSVAEASFFSPLTLEDFFLTFLVFLSEIHSDMSVQVSILIMDTG